MEKPRKFKDRPDLSNIDPFEYIDHKGVYPKGVGVGSVLVEPKDSYYIYKDPRCGKLIESHDIVRSCPNCDKNNNKNRR